MHVGQHWVVDQDWGHERVAVQTLLVQFVDIGRIATTNLRYASTLDWVLSVGFCEVDAGVVADSLPIACCKRWRNSGEATFGWRAMARTGRHCHRARD